MDSLSILGKHFVSTHVSELGAPKPIYITTDDVVAVALEALRSYQVGAVIINDENDVLQGIFSERDVLTKLSDSSCKIEETPISDLMTASPEVVKPNASIARAIHMMVVGGYRHIPIVFARSMVKSICSVKGVVDHVYKLLVAREEGLDIFKDDRGLVDQFFAQNLRVLNPCDPSPIVVSSDDTVQHAIQALCKNSIGSVVVLENSGSVAGIFTERDYLQNFTDCCSNPDALVSEFMTSKPRMLTENDTVELAFQVMSQGGFRHIPVLNLSLIHI